MYLFYTIRKILYIISYIIYSKYNIVYIVFYICIKYIFIKMVTNPANGLLTATHQGRKRPSNQLPSWKIDHLVLCFSHQNISKHPI